MKCKSSLLVALLPIAWTSAAAQEQPARQQQSRSTAAARLAARLPADSLAVLEVPDAGAAARALEELAAPVVAALPEAQKTAVALGRLALEGRLGVSLEEAARALAGGGLACSFRAAGGRVQALVVCRPGDPERARALLESLPAAVHHRWEGDLLLLARARDPLALREAEAAAEPPGERSRRAHAFLTVDLAMLRRLRPGFGEPEARLDPAGRLLLAPLIPALGKASRLSVAVAAGEGLELTATLDAGTEDSVWSGLLARGGAREVPRFDAGAVVSVDRSLRALFEDPERFLGEEHAVRVRAFLSIADRLVGRQATFADDLLGALREPVHLVVTVPEESEDKVLSPPLLLPDFALVAEVAEPEVEGVLRRTAQVLSIISNRERRRIDKDPFRVRAVSDLEWRGLTSALPAWRGPGAPPAERALSPTLLLGHGHAVLASTTAAAERALSACGEEARERVTGDLLRVSGARASAMITRNLDVLTAARVLDEGEGLQQAERHWRTVRSVIESLELEVRLRPDEHRTEMVLTLRRRP